MHGRIANLYMCNMYSEEKNGLVWDGEPTYQAVDLTIDSYVITPFHGSGKRRPKKSQIVALLGYSIISSPNFITDWRSITREVTWFTFSCLPCAKTEANNCKICINKILGIGDTEKAIHGDDKERNSMDSALKFPCINIKWFINLPVHHDLHYMIGWRLSYIHSKTL